MRACRNGFPDVVKILDQIVANMLKLAPGEELDINNVTLRFAMDVTGEIEPVCASISLSSIECMLLLHPDDCRRSMQEHGEKLLEVWLLLALYWRGTRVNAVALQSSP